MPFQHDLTVRFYETDPAGIVFFGRYFEYCQAAYEELFRTMASRDDETDRTWGMPVIRVESDFLRPARLGERLTVAVTVEQVAKYTVTLTYRISGGDGPKATVRIAHAFVDRKTFKPTAPPESLRLALEEIARSG
jgi:YbgC/YbaW family acyl-CoA thioester hydrolase